MHDFLHPSDLTVQSPEFLDTHVYKLQFLDADLSKVDGEQISDAYYNYFLGNDPTNWVSRAYSFEKLRYEEIYPNIDLKLYTKEYSLKYDFIVFPGGDPAMIQQEYEGQYDVKLNGGNLEIDLSVGNVMELAPYAYQFIDGKLIDVECEFQVRKDVVSFKIGDYNSNHKLVIDPEVSFASYIGSPASNFGFTASNDSQGNLIAGAAFSALIIQPLLGQNK